MRHFYRSKKDRMIAGVAGGFAEYFHIDPIIIRALFVAAALSGGFGVLMYIILMLAVPEKGEEQEVKEVKENQKDFTKKRVVVGGLVLIVIGVMFLANNFIPGINIWNFWPVFIIAIGISMLLNATHKT